MERGDGRDDDVQPACPNPRHSCLDEEARGDKRTSIPYTGRTPSTKGLTRELLGGACKFFQSPGLYATRLVKLYGAQQAPKRPSLPEPLCPRLGWLVVGKHPPHAFSRL